MIISYAGSGKILKSNGRLKALFLRPMWRRILLFDRWNLGTLTTCIIGLWNLNCHQHKKCDSTSDQYSQGKYLLLSSQILMKLG